MNLMLDMEKGFLLDYLERFAAVPFSVVLPDGSKHLLGTGNPKFQVRLRDELNKKALLKSTSLALAEAYMDGILEIEGDLFKTLTLFLSQIQNFTSDKHSLGPLLHTHLSPRRQREEVQSHYDIGNDFYRLWLDQTMSYSCGYFQSEDDSLFLAQRNKVHRILKKLSLRPGMSLLDIGCGWGYLLLEAAKTYKIRGLGITLSTEQQKRFQELIKQEHLENLLEVRLMDYRDLKKSNMRFDRITSVGMLEHVGRPNYGLFLENASHVLKDGGAFLLHYISAQREYPGDPFLRKYIFPGGAIPSLREIVSLLPENQFYTLDIESLRRHYVKTLLCWNENFQSHRHIVQKMFDLRFVRMWELYLCSCAAAFQNGIVDLHQILVTKGVNNTLPMTRMYDTPEKSLLASFENLRHLC